MTGATLEIGSDKDNGLVDVKDKQSHNAAVSQHKAFDALRSKGFDKIDDERKKIALKDTYESETLYLGRDRRSQNLINELLKGKPEEIDARVTAIRTELGNLPADVKAKLEELNALNAKLEKGEKLTKDETDRARALGKEKPVLDARAKWWTVAMIDGIQNSDGSNKDFPQGTFKEGIAHAYSSIGESPKATTELKTTLDRVKEVERIVKLHMDKTIPTVFDKVANGVAKPEAISTTIPDAPPAPVTVDPAVVGNSKLGCIQGFVLQQMTSWGGPKNELRIMQIPPALAKSSGLQAGDVLDMEAFMKGKEGTALEVFQQMIRDSGGKSINLRDLGITVRRYDGKPGYNSGTPLTEAEVEENKGINIPVEAVDNNSGLGLRVSPWKLMDAKVATGIDIDGLDSRLPQEIRDQFKEEGGIFGGLRSHITAFRLGTGPEYRNEKATLEQFQKTVEGMKVGEEITLTVQVSDTKSRTVKLTKRYGVVDASMTLKTDWAGSENVPTFWGGAKSEVPYSCGVDNSNDFKW